jgi:hypothetical protein
MKKMGLLLQSRKKTCWNHMHKGHIMWGKSAAEAAHMTGPNLEVDGGRTLEAGLRA